MVLLACVAVGAAGRPAARAGRAVLAVQRKALSRHQRCRERRAGVTQRPERAFRDAGHVANAPFAARREPAFGTASSKL